MAVSISRIVPEIVRCLTKDHSDLLNESVAFLHGEMDARIFDQGLSTDGEPHDSIVQANPPLAGAYSRSHGNRRENAGLDTAFIDLVFSGAMRLDFDFDDENKIGFTTPESAEIAEYNEVYRRKLIFGPTEQELIDFENFIFVAVEEDVQECIENIDS